MLLKVAACDERGWVRDDHSRVTWDQVEVIGECQYLGKALAANFSFCYRP